MTQLLGLAVNVAMKLLLSSGSFYRESLEKSFYMAYRAGFDGVEVIMNEIYYREDVVEYLSELGKIVPVEAMHAPFLVDGPSRVKVVSLNKCVEIALSLGVKKIVFHPPMKFFLEPYYWWWFLKNSFNGVDRVELCLENMPQKRWGKGRMSLWSFKSFERLKRAAQKRGLFLAFDTTHCGTSGIPLIEAFEMMGGIELVRHIHFSDFAEREGRFVEHLFPGEGELPLFEFIEYLKSKGYTETVTVEVSPDALPQDDIERINKLKALIDRIKG
ncbi:MAG: sugar phosphate isomerase/epimerase [Deferribacteres bacterium]|nr:sugar phosphate isomerase/epimerase [Deferribacteres bacterium]